MVNDLFTKLVAIPSPSGYESIVGKFVEKELLDLGCEVKIDKEGNVLAKSKGKGSPILISGHLDTVQGQTKVKPVIQNGIIRSMGKTILGGDNKASVAAILTSLKRVANKKRRNLEIIFSVREETDGGVSKIDLSWVKSKVGISADSGKPIGSIISKTPFIEGFEVEVQGKSSHSSEPEFGVNALSIASHAISQFKWGKIDDLSTANIGLIEGGSAVNITPSKIVLIGEIRSYLKSNLDIISEKLEKCFKKSAKLFGGRIKINYYSYCDGYNHSGTEASYSEITKVYKHLKIYETSMEDFGGSDANFFNKHGISVVDIGDGVFNPHTDKEFVSVKDLKKLTDIFANYISA